MLRKPLPNFVKKNMQNSERLNVVFDSVVLVSAFVTREGFARALLVRCALETNLYTAEEILQETRHVLLEREHLRKRFAYDEIDVNEFIEAYRDGCTVISPLPELHVVVRDPEDDMIIACAVVANADYIVSRDKDLLDLGAYREIKIVSPEAFIQILRERTNDVKET